MSSGKINYTTSKINELLGKIDADKSYYAGEGIIREEQGSGVVFKIDTTWLTNYIKTVAPSGGSSSGGSSGGSSDSSQGGSTTTPKTTGLTISGPSTFDDCTYNGYTQTLNVNLEPSNASSNISWTSSNTGLVKVTGNGTSATVKIDGDILSDEVVTVTATTTDGTNISVSWTFNVKVKVNSLEFSKKEIELINDDDDLSETIFITMNDTPGITNIDDYVRWENSNENAVRLTHTDRVVIVTPKNNGTATIKAVSKEDESIYAACVVTVKEAEIAVTSLTINNPSNSKYLSVGSLVTLETTIDPSNATNTSVTWKSENSGIATVSSSGAVKGISPGSANITATLASNSSISDTYNISVVNPVTGISLNETSLSLNAGDTYQLDASVIPDEATLKTVNWISEDTEIVKVNNSGFVTAISNKGGGVGSSVIRAISETNPDVSALCYVGVSVPLTGISLNKTTTTIPVDSSETLIPIFIPSSATNKNVTWSTTNSSVATVSSGIVTAIKEGTANISVTSDENYNFSKTCKVTVSAIDGDFTVSPTSLTLATGETATITITATGNAKYQKYWIPGNGTYIKSEVSEISVDETTGIGTAEITAAASPAGTGTIYVKCLTNTALYSDKSISITVYKNEEDEDKIPVTNLSLSPSEITDLVVGDTITLTPIYDPSNATNKGITWLSNYPSVATVSSDGVVTGIAPGDVSIKATLTDDESISAQCPIKVIESSEFIDVTDISVSGSSSVYVNSLYSDKQTIEAEVIPSNATKQELEWELTNNVGSPIAIWSTSDDTHSWTYQGKYNWDTSQNAGGSAIVQVKSLSNPEIIKNITLKVIKGQPDDEIWYDTTDGNDISVSL